MDSSSRVLLASGLTYVLFAYIHSLCHRRLTFEKSYISIAIDDALVSRVCIGLASIILLSTVTIEWKRCDVRLRVERTLCALIVGMSIVMMSACRVSVDETVHRTYVGAWIVSTISLAALVTVINESKRFALRAMLSALLVATLFGSSCNPASGMVLTACEWVFALAFFLLMATQKEPSRVSSTLPGCG